MHLSKIALALLPILSAATFNVSEETPLYDTSDMTFTWSTLTEEELRRFYPDVDLSSLGGQLQAVSNETHSVGERQANGPGYNVVAGGLAISGYFAFLGGADMIINAINACYDESGTYQGGAECWIRGVQSGIAHTFAAGVGLVGGRQFIMYFWRAAVEQAIGPDPGAAKRWIGGGSQITERQMCSDKLDDFASSIRFDGTNGLKIAGKDFGCYEPDSDDLTTIYGLMGQVAEQMMDQRASDTHFTVFLDSDRRQVLGRVHMQIDSVQTDLCPFDIDGGDSCFANV